MQRDLLFLSEAIQAAEKIVRLSEGATADSLQADGRSRRRSLELHCARRSLQPVHPEGTVPVHLVAPTIAMRNRVVHGYWWADLQVLLDTVQEDLPKLITQLDQALATLS